MKSGHAKVKMWAELKSFGYKDLYTEYEKQEQLNRAPFGRVWDQTQYGSTTVDNFLYLCSSFPKFSRFLVTLAAVGGAGGWEAGSGWWSSEAKLCCCWVPPSVQELPNTRTFLQTNPAVTGHYPTAPLSLIRSLNNPISSKGQIISLCPKQCDPWVSYSWLFSPKAVFLMILKPFHSELLKTKRLC